MSGLSVKVSRLLLQHRDARLIVLHDGYWVLFVTQLLEYVSAPEDVGCDLINGGYLSFGRGSDNCLDSASF